MKEIKKKNNLESLKGTTANFPEKSKSSFTFLLNSSIFN